MQKQKLIGFEPFNKFLFKSCYYHHLLACYSFYGADPEILLSNYITLYSNSEDTFKEYCVFDKRQLRKISGVYDEKLTEPSDFAGEVISLIDNGTPIIAAVDTYYLPYRKNDYKKTHYLHYILIVGYDKESRKYDCIDHMFNNSLNYIPTQLSFSALKKAHQGAIELNKTGRTFVAVKRKTPQQVVLSDAKKQRLRTYICNSRNIKNDILLSICKLVQSNEYERLRKICDRLARYKWTLILRAHSIGADKKGVYINLQRAANNISYACGAIFKASIVKYMSPQTQEKIQTRIQETMQIEEDLHNALLQKYCKNETD